ncbi:serine/threonine protein kinase [Solirubrobacter pauli]|uniref:non-specific serine/threonine protein kinase n=2 Tax=Solirubrobacter pauli TaxID=166793 RepID=A0A660LAG3_9ACTN|nr:serine/threonine protein kinase [Solirubrobacter pauli]
MPEVMKTVGRYEILREVGRGGMAMVYLARQTDLDRFVALKELGAFHASDPAFAQRFLRESRVAGSLSHPNVVTVHDYFEHDGTPYIAMEYIERGSLRPHVGRMTMAQIGGVLEGLLAGLTHAETHEIVHRDLKPENVMVTADGRVKIADFGIAKATTKMQTGAFLTATGTTVGTPTYMAPEQAMAQDIGPWTDLYSVGCMAFELFTGNVPFHDSDAPMAILLRHVNEEIPAVKTVRPEVDQRISDWIERLLVKEPEARTRNAQDAWDDFEEILISLLGPRWRREARLVERRTEDTNGGAKPLTPAPFQGTSVHGGEASEEFKSFAWGAPAGDTGGTPAAPPMWTPPPSEATPAIPEPIVGPPTPMPSQAIPAPLPVEDEPTGVTGFVTFGVPAPAPPSDVLLPSPDTPVSDTPEALATPPADAAPPVEFETYVAPPPSRPPTKEPPTPAQAAPPVPPTPAAPSGPGSVAPGSPLAPDTSREPAKDDRKAGLAGAAGAAALAGGAAAATPASAKPAVEPLPAGAADTMMPSKATPPPAPPKPPKAPKAKSPGGGDRPGWLVPVAVGGAAIVAVIAGIALMGGGDDTPERAAATSTATPAATQQATLPVEANGIRVSVPAGWSDGATADIPGFADGAVTMGGPKGGTIVFGRADDSAADPTLLPEELRGETPPTAATVDLDGGVQAAKYADLPIGSQTGTVLSVPTGDGVAMLACIADPKTCDTIASSMTVTGDKTFPVGPSDTYQTKVEKILGRLDKAEKSAARDLDNAGKRTTQVSATSRLGSAYASAATSLGKLSTSPADEASRAQLVAALKDASAAYKKAASEGRAKDRNGFKKQNKPLAAAGKDLQTGFDGFETAGYELSSAAVKRAVAVKKLPVLKRDKKKAASPPSGGRSTATPSSTPTPNTGSTGNSTPPPTNNVAPRNTSPAPQNNSPAPTKKKSSGGDSLSGGGEG